MGSPTRFLRRLRVSEEREELSVAILFCMDDKPSSRVEELGDDGGEVPRVRAKAHRCPREGGLNDAMAARFFAQAAANERDRRRVVEGGKFSQGVKKKNFSISLERREADCVSRNGDRCAVGDVRLPESAADAEGRGAATDEGLRARRRWQVRKRNSSSPGCVLAPIKRGRFAKPACWRITDPWVISHADSV